MMRRQVTPWRLSRRGQEIKDPCTTLSWTGHENNIARTSRFCGVEQVTTISRSWGWPTVDLAETWRLSMWMMTFPNAPTIYYKPDLHCPPALGDSSCAYGSWRCWFGDLSEPKLVEIPSSRKKKVLQAYGGAMGDQYVSVNVVTNWFKW